MPLDEARRRREEKFKQSIGLEHWSWCPQTITLQHATGRERPIKLNAIFDWNRQKSLITHLAARMARLECCEKKDLKVDTIIHGEVISQCAYWVPLEDWREETIY